MESSLSRITATSDVYLVEQDDSLRRRGNENSSRSPDNVENRQQTVTQLNLAEILSNNNNVTPQQVGQILQAIGDELNNAFKFHMRSSKNG